MLAFDTIIDLGVLLVFNTHSVE